MPSESLRGCGYRKVGSLYLCGTGIAVPCDMLPLELTPCPTCGFEIPFTRNLMRINKQWITNKAEKHHSNIPTLDPKDCTCYQLYRNLKCPLCFPNKNNLTHYGLMWVGERYYTPSSFVKEAIKMGVSKKIPDVPKWLEMGKTWILLAHKKVPFYNPEDLKFTPFSATKVLATKEPEYKPAIFYAFRPQTIEMPIWKSQATEEYLKELQEKGITPIVIEDNDSVHAPSKSNKNKNLISDYSN